MSLVAKQNARKPPNTARDNRPDNAAEPASSGNHVSNRENIPVKVRQAGGPTVRVVACRVSGPNNRFDRNIPPEQILG